MSLVEGLSAAAQALSIAKTLRDVEKSYDAATYKSKIIELIDALTDAKIALAEAREQQSIHERELEQLRNSMNEKATLVDGPNGYEYKPDEHGKPHGYPVCPRCLAVDQRTIRMVQNRTWSAGKCPACATEYYPVDPIGSEAKASAERRRAAENRAAAEYATSSNIWGRV